MAMITVVGLGVNWQNCPTPSEYPSVLQVFDLSDMCKNRGCPPSEKTVAAKQTPHGMPSFVFETPDDLAVPGQQISAAEAAFFVANGFLVKEGLLADDAVDDALERIWWHVEDRVPVARDNVGRRLAGASRASGATPRWAPTPPVPRAGPHAGRQRIVHSGATLKLHYLGGADFLLDLVPNNGRVRGVAQALLGDLKASERTRGVYALFPTNQQQGSASTGTSALSPHTDQVCQQLNACAYLADVPPRNGGFTVYPGSHKAMFQTHKYAANWSPLPTFRDALRKVVEEIRPWELAGRKGDVIFWHGRAVHSPGVHVGERIRWAVFADFTHNRETLTANEHRALGQFEWFKDAKLFREDHEVAEGGMWRGWRLGGWPLATA